jgi:hypothetical protein
MTDNQIQDDAWIVAHADELKAELMKLAESGADRPAPDTLLGRTLELFTMESDER